MRGAARPRLIFELPAAVFGLEVDRVIRGQPSPTRLDTRGFRQHSEDT